MKIFLSVFCFVLLNIHSLASGNGPQKATTGDRIISIIKHKIEIGIKASGNIERIQNLRRERNDYYWNSGLGKINIDFADKINFVKNICRDLECNRELEKTYLDDLKQKHDQYIESQFSEYFEPKQEYKELEAKAIKETLPYGLVLFTDANDDGILDEHELKILFAALGVDFVIGLSAENYADIILSVTPKHSSDLMQALYKRMFALDQRYEHASFEDIEEIKAFRIKLGLY